MINRMVFLFVFYFFIDATLNSVSTLDKTMASASLFGFETEEPRQGIA